MTIQDLGSIGEVVGALATVATLAYLAVQIRANTRMMRSQSKHFSQQANAEYAMALAQSPQLADLFSRGLASFDSLTDGERIQFTFLFSQIVGVAEHAYIDAQEGVVDSAHLERTVAGIATLLASPGGRSYWKTFAVHGGYSDHFRAFVDSKLADRKHLPKSPGPAA